MEAVTVPIDQIMPAVWNPRVDLQPGMPEWDQIDTWLDTWGLVVPLIVNSRTGTLVSGHQRCAVLAHRGVATVDVVYVDLDPEGEKALAVAMNAITGRWDDTVLTGVLATLEQAGLLDTTGFDTADLARLADQLTDDLDALDDLYASVPEPVDTLRPDETVTCPACGHTQGVWE